MVTTSWFYYPFKNKRACSQSELLSTKQAINTMSSVEDVSTAPTQDRTQKLSAPGKTKKNSSAPNGGSHRGRDKEHQPSAKDQTQRSETDFQRDVDDDDDESDMVPPDPVPEPSSEEHNSRLGVIRAEIDDMELKVVIKILNIYLIRLLCTESSTYRRQSILILQKRKICVKCKMQELRI